jgi:Flp pilus assembly protein TadD
MVFWQGAILLQQRPPTEALAGALDFVRRAVALDAGDAEARACLSVGLTYIQDYEGALTEARRALEMSPNLVGAHHALASELQV